MDFKDMLEARRNVRAHGEERYKAESKSRLEKIISTKIRTTMIGALATIEEHFGFLWQNRSSEEATHFEGLYEKVRQEILDNGNNQIRNVKVELDHYSVEWLKYKLTLPFRQPGSKPEESNEQE